MTRRTCSPVGIALIHRFEGLRLEAYLCTGKKWTIGWGHTGPEVHEGLVITKKKADELFAADLRRFEESVDNLAPTWLNRHQFDALVSFTYNLGPKVFRESTLRRLLFLGPPDIEGAAFQFSKFIHADGKVDRGLVLRRAAERELFLRPMLRVV